MQLLIILNKGAEKNTVSLLNCRDLIKIVIKVSAK